MEKRVTKFTGSLDEVIAMLIKARENGDSIVYNFNGVDLHSDTVTVDSAYIDITGYDKATYKKIIEEEKKKFLEESDKALTQKVELIPEYIERASKIIYPENIEEWEKLLIDCSKSLYSMLVIEKTLTVMEVLENGASMEEVKTLLDKQKHSGFSYGLLRNLVLFFSKRGPELYRATSITNLTDEEIKRIDSIEKKNQKLKEKQNKK